MAAVAEVLCQHLVDHYIDIGRQSVASFPGSRRSIAVIVEHLTFRGSRDETAADKVVLERNPDMNLQPSAIRIDQVFDNLPVHNCDHVIAVLCVLSHTERMINGAKHCPNMIERIVLSQVASERKWWSFQILAITR